MVCGSIGNAKRETAGSDQRRQGTRFKTLIMGCVSVVALTVGLTAARAQDDAAQGDQSATQAAAPDKSGVQEVQITGTRIQRSGFSTPTPVTVIDRETMDALGFEKPDR